MNQRIGPKRLSIRQIQGAAQRSAHDAAQVSTRGVVTQVSRDGFWLQEAKKREGTSSGIFVHAPDHAEKLTPGDEISVTADVCEHRPEWSRKHELTETQLTDVAQLNVLSRGNDIPVAVDLPGIASPEDAAGAWERFEGMQVRLDHAVVMGPQRYGTVQVETAPGAIPVEVSTRGLDATVGEGDRLSGVTGVLRYRAGLFQIEARSVEGIADIDRARQKEVTKLVGDARHVTVASYNVENLDPHYEDPGRTQGHRRGDDDVGRGKFVGVATDIVEGLQSPDIIALQEMQDGDGSEMTDETSAADTAAMLINHIIAMGGPAYTYVELPPEAHVDGGQPGGNIRVGYLYRADRVDLVADSVHRLGEGSDSFERTRKTLGATFAFPDPDGGKPQRLTLFNNHFSSKSGSSATMGSAPEEDPAAASRAEQGAMVASAASAAAADTGDVVIALGDFNDTEDSPVVSAFTAEGFTHFAEDLPREDRYSHYYRGHQGLIDHALLKNVEPGQLESDIVHRNAMFEDRSSDHDPVLMRIEMFADES